jgi:hypothetical protein
MHRSNRDTIAAGAGVEVATLPRVDTSRVALSPQHLPVARWVTPARRLVAV